MTSYQNHQANENNFRPFPPQQNVNQVVQTSLENQQGNYMQGPYSQQHLFDPNVLARHQSQSYPSVNPWQTSLQNQSNFPGHAHSQPTNYPILPQNIVEQIRSCAGSTTPIFILPSSCHQTTPQQPSMGPMASGMASGIATQIPTIYCPPSYIPYPFPLPIYDPLALVSGTKGNSQRCACFAKKPVEYAMNVDFAETNYCEVESAKHQCTDEMDETICSKKNCPSALNLQALVSQLLSVQGIIACAATRLILRKIPGSNVTTQMEETMEKAKRSLCQLTKEQLLTESRNVQQVNALINLHMTANPPPNVIPILTLVQLKMNVLKAQVERLLNGKLMENQGVGVEETASMDPMVLALKSDSELRELLSALRQKECDERVNVSFAPYRSQRIIAETRLNNIQSKISQVEGEMDRRRATSLRGPALVSYGTQQYGNPCDSTQNAANRYSWNQNYESPNPFAITLRSPRRLNLKPHVGSPCTTYDKPNAARTADDSSKSPDAAKKFATSCSDKGTEPDDQTRRRGKTDRSPDRKSSSENCSCDDSTSSEESEEEAKKKLHAKTDDAEMDDARKEVKDVQVATDETPGTTGKTTELPDSSRKTFADKEVGTHSDTQVPEKDETPAKEPEDRRETTSRLSTSESASPEKEIHVQNATQVRGTDDQESAVFRTSKTIRLTENGLEEEANKENSSLAGATEQIQRTFKSSLLFVPRKKSEQRKNDQEPSTSDKRKSGKRPKEPSVLSRESRSKAKTPDRQGDKERTRISSPLTLTQRKSKFK